MGNRQFKVGDEVIVTEEHWNFIPVHSIGVVSSIEGIHPGVWVTFKNVHKSDRDDGGWVHYGLRLATPLDKLL